MSKEGSQMDLKCKTGHLWGKEVLVNGTVYKISDQGIVTGLKDEDRKRLLANRGGWDPAPIQAPVKAEPSASEPAKDAPPPPAGPPPAPPAEPEHLDEAAKRRSPPLRRG
jgi:hypothetical protein